MRESVELLRHKAPRIGMVVALTSVLSCAEPAGAKEDVCKQIAESANGIEAVCVGSFDMRPEKGDTFSRVRLVEVKYKSPLDGSVVICPVFEEYGDQGFNGSMGIGLAADCRVIED